MNRLLFLVSTRWPWPTKGLTMVQGRTNTNVLPDVSTFPRAARDTCSIVTGARPRNSLEITWWRWLKISEFSAEFSWNCRSEEKTLTQRDLAPSFGQIIPNSSVFSSLFPFLYADFFVSWFLVVIFFWQRERRWTGWFPLIWG